MVHLAAVVACLPGGDEARRGSHLAHTAFLSSRTKVMQLYRLQELVLILFLIVQQVLAAAGAELWTQAPLFPVLLASSHNISGQQCRQDNRLFLEHLRNFSLWAVQMFDASTKIPEGLLAGSTYHLGHFDQCLGIAIHFGEQEVKGQYCIADVSILHRGSRQPCDQELLPTGSAWQKIQWCGDPSKVRRDLVHWALCVPASCTPQDVHSGLSQALASLETSMGVVFNVSVPPEQCSILDEETQLGASVISLGCVLVVIISLFLACTVFDYVCCSDDSRKMNRTPGHMVNQGMEGGGCRRFPLQEYILAFSARRNLPKLTRVTCRQPAFEFSHGLRFFFMICVITGHRMLLFVDFPVFNVEAYEMITQNAGFMGNGAVVVDFFFFLSGVLLAYMSFEKFEKDGKINLFLVFLSYLIRIMPVYMMIVWFHSSLLGHMGSGPYWKAIVNTEQCRCADTWWANFLFIHNYWDPKNMCMLPSWFLATHFHMYIICLLLISFLWYLPSLGWTLFLFSTAMSVIIPFCSIWWYKLDPIVKLFPGYGPGLLNNREFYMMYVKTHNRAAPALIGTMTGVLLFKTRKSTFHLTKIQSHTIFLGAWILMFFIMASCYTFYQQDWPNKAIEAGLYGSLHHLCIAICFGIIFFVTTFGDLGIYTNISCSTVSVILGRLTYNAYLLHYMVLLYDLGAMRVPRYLSFFTTSRAVIADIFIAYLLAFITVLSIEMPIREILKKLIYGKEAMN